MAITEQEERDFWKLMDRVYALAPSGGSLHHMIEDQNVEDHWFENGYRPLEDATSQQIDAERALWDALCQMRFSQRLGLILAYHLEREYS